MVIQVPFDEKGEKTLTRTDGKYPEMLMDITVRRLSAGEEMTVRSPGKETAVMLLEGEVTFRWQGKEAAGSRRNVFDERPWALHVCRDVEVVVTARRDSELIIQSTENEKIFPDTLYRPEDCTFATAGEGIWDGAAKREIVTVFDYANAPYSHMVLGEVINLPGRWSSYIPHFHPQPEVYYYKFSKPQGFGLCLIGDEAFRSTDGACAVIPGGRIHPQVTAPGYKMYYCWMIRHLPHDPWVGTRIDQKEHTWLLAEGEIKYK